MEAYRNAFGLMVPSLSTEIQRAFIPEYQSRNRPYSPQEIQDSSKSN